MHRKPIYMFLLFAFVLVNTTNSFAQHELIFPIVATTSTGDCATSCQYWTSNPLLFNPNDATATMTFMSYDANGNVVASSGPVSARPFQAVAVPGPSFRTGWLKISSSQALIGREYLQSMSVSGTKTDLRSQINLVPASLSRRHFVRAESFGPVGIAIVFPSVAGGPPATGKLIHRDDDGTTISEKQFVIPPNGQLIGYLNELLPAEPQNANLPPNSVFPFFGSAEFVFDKDVAMTALQFAASRTPQEVVVETFSGQSETTK